MSATEVLTSARRSRGGARRLSVRAVALLLMGVFLAALMIALVFGASTYRAVVADQAAADSIRTQAGVLTNIVRSNDAFGALSTARGPQGDALVLTETLESGSYETRVYLYDGYIVSEYAIAGRPFDPSSSTRLVKSDTFSFTFADGLLSITGDQGTFDVCLRTDQGGAL